MCAGRPTLFNGSASDMKQQYLTQPAPLDNFVSRLYSSLRKSCGTTDEAPLVAMRALRQP